MGYNVSSAIAKTMAENANDPDEWDTDPDFVVRISIELTLEKK